MSINYNTQTTSTNNLGNNVTPELKAYYDRQMIRVCQPKTGSWTVRTEQAYPKGFRKDY